MNGDVRNRRWQQKGGLDSRRGCLQPWRDDAVADGDANDQAENDPDHHIAHDSALPNFNTTTGGSASVSPFSLGSGLVSVKKLVRRIHGCLTPNRPRVTRGEYRVVQAQASICLLVSEGEALPKRQDPTSEICCSRRLIQ